MTSDSTTPPDPADSPQAPTTSPDEAMATSGATAGSRDEAGAAAPEPTAASGTLSARRGSRTPQSMKPSTAAAKLDVYLPATPAEFRAGMVTRDQLDALQRTPPPWLVELRRNGPHPRSVVAARLRVSTSGLARAGLTEALTTAQIEDLIANPPEWLHRERATLAEVKREEQRIKERDAQRRAGPGRPA